MARKRKVQASNSAARGTQGTQCSIDAFFRKQAAPPPLKKADPPRALKAPAIAKAAPPKFTLKGPVSSYPGGGLEPHTKNTQRSIGTNEGLVCPSIAQHESKGAQGQIATCRGSTGGADPLWESNKRLRTSHSPGVLQTQDEDAVEIEWRTSPTFERLKASVTTLPRDVPSQECSPAVLHAAQLALNGLTATRAFVSPEEKALSATLRLEQWLSACPSPQQGDPGRQPEANLGLKATGPENLVAEVPANRMLGSTPGWNRAGSSTIGPHGKRRSRLQGSIEATKRKQHLLSPLGDRRQVLLDLLDRVETAVQTKQPLTSPLAHSDSPTIASNHSAACTPVSLRAPMRACLSPELLGPFECQKLVQAKQDRNLEIKAEQKQEAEGTQNKQEQGMTRSTQAKAICDQGRGKILSKQEGARVKCLEVSNDPEGGIRHKQEIENRKGMIREEIDLEIRTGVPAGTAQDLATCQLSAGVTTPSLEQAGALDDFDAELLAILERYEANPSQDNPSAKNAEKVCQQKPRAKNAEKVCQQKARARKEKTLGSNCFQGTVLEVVEGEHPTPTGSRFEKVLFVECRTRTLTVHLRDEWAHTAVCGGDIISILLEQAESEEGSICTIDSHRNLLVLHPNVLISGSKVGSSFSCLRRSVLDERLRQSDAGAAALFGTLLHALFQEGLLKPELSSQDLEKEAWAIIQRNADKLYAAGENESGAYAHMIESIPAIQAWISSFLQTRGQPARVDFGGMERHGVQVHNVEDIEESIWAPSLGLKGMLDASLQIDLTDLNTMAVTSQVVPFELKTGKKTTGNALTSHRAQVILYTLLMSHRYGQAVEAGLLLYLQTGETQGVRAVRAEVIGLIMRRNELASALLDARHQKLPPVAEDSRICKWCPHLSSCAVYNKAVDDVSSPDALFSERSCHLAPPHLEFLKHWEKLIDLEARDIQAAQHEIWTKEGPQRQSEGKCLAGLSLSTAQSLSAAKKEKFLYKFQVAAGGNINPLVEGDHVLLSTEGPKALIGIARATVASVSATSIKVWLPRRLRLPRQGTLCGPERLLREKWRLDKDESAYHYTLMRTNILNLFTSEGAHHLREQVVDLQAPQFEDPLTQTSTPGARYVAGLKNINGEQRAAIEKVLYMKDHCILLGMPGTGKTTTIVHAVRALLARGASILLTSYTNSAVDNILLKLLEQGVDFVRVGRVDAMHPGVQSHALDQPDEQRCSVSVAEIESRVSGAQIVGATCLGITHSLFTKRSFDVCIVDEASQITLPVCLGPLRCARAFVLVGDHHQLPPLVRNLAAREGGMAISLFRRLADAHPAAVATLSSQYRMAADIMALSNSLVYDGRLSCASQEVAEAQLHLPKALPAALPQWLHQVLDPARRVVVLDTDHVKGCEEVRVHEAVQNPGEAAILSSVVHALAAGGLPMTKVGAICPYQAQVRLVKTLTSVHCENGLEVHTVDKYQGRDKECILVSFTRRNEASNAGVLLADLHRINVAITRAKTKLVLVGSRSTLSTVPHLRDLFDMAEKNKWLFQLPADAIETSLRLSSAGDDSACMAKPSLLGSLRVFQAGLQAGVSQDQAKNICGKGRVANVGRTALKQLPVNTVQKNWHN